MEDRTLKFAKNVRSFVKKFEGPEKKIKVLLSAPQEDLRSNSDGRWDRVVNASRAHIISRISTDCLDAYLLSESSLFVWKDAVLIITCGKTTPIDAFHEIIDGVVEKSVVSVFYERKNFMFPREQPSDFEKEVKSIADRFPGKSRRHGPADRDHVHFSCSSPANAALNPDDTLQMLMHDLDPSVMELFSIKSTNTSDQARKKSGLDQLYPYMTTDCHLFTPYGFSLNGIFKHRYFTVHITPQREGSYASFETNVREKNYKKVMEEVLSIFKPGRFTLVHMTNVNDRRLALNNGTMDVIPGYRVTERDINGFDFGYAVTFMNLEKQEGKTGIYVG